MAHSPSAAPLLGIDVGTSSVKAGVFSETGHLLGLGRAPYRSDSPHPGWAEVEPEQWWDGVIAAVGEACAEARVPPTDLRAIGIGVLFPAVIPMDKAGRALHPAILYSDQRSLAQVRAIEGLVPRDTLEPLIGNTLAPGTSAVTSLAWLRDERPAAWSAATCIGWANTFVTGRLTGEFRTDPSMAALSGLIDIRDPHAWDSRLCDRLGIDASLLPPIADPDEVIGQVTAAAAHATGLRPGTPVVCGTGDVPVSTLGVGALAPGAAAYAAGSSDCVALVLRNPSPDRRIVSATYVPRGAWLGIGTTTSSGTSVEWFVREILGAGEADGPTQMAELAAASPAGGRGLLFTPYLQGGRTPIWDPRARGCFVGLSGSTTRSDLARAVLEGVAFSLRQLVECLEGVAGTPIKELLAMGGGTRTPLWNRIKADVLQREMRMVDFPEPGALGAALLAGVGAGVYASIEQAVEATRPAVSSSLLTPNPTMAALYDDRFALFADAYPATRDLTQRLAAG